jgi:hypothetical protein
VDRGFPPHLICRLVIAEADVNRVPKELVGCPYQIGDLRNELGLDPMHSRQKNEWRPETVERGSGAVRADALHASELRRSRRSARTSIGIPVPTRPA